MKEGIVMTRLEASELFTLLSGARIKLQGRLQTIAQKYYDKLELILMSDYKPEKKENDTRD